MIFAAGFGTRMRELTRDRPKPMLRVMDRTLIDHMLNLVAAAGIKRVVVNTHYLAHVIEAHLADRDVTVIHETPDVLETGGGLKNALPVLGPGPVLTLNPDAWFDGPNPVRLLLDAWQGGAGAQLLVVPRDRALCHAGAGDFDMQAGGQLCRRTSANAECVYTGAQIITPVELADIEEKAFSLNLLWDRMLARGEVTGVVYPGRWVDVGTPEGLAQAKRIAWGRDV